MGVFSAVAGNQLPNQLQKRVLPALFHLRCPSQSHQRSARGRTRLTTVTSILYLIGRIHSRSSHPNGCAHSWCFSTLKNIFSEKVEKRQLWVRPVRIVETQLYKLRGTCGRLDVLCKYGVRGAGLNRNMEWGVGVRTYADSLQAGDKFLGRVSGWW